MLVPAVAVAALFAAAAATVVMRFELLGSGIAHKLHMTAVTHCLTSELVVEVHDHLVVGHFDNLVSAKKI